MAIREKMVLEDLNFIKFKLNDIDHKYNCLKAFDIASNLGQGQIRCIKLAEGLTAIHFDIRLRAGVEVEVDFDSKDRVHFLYSQVGNCLHRFDSETTLNKVTEKQTAVAISGSGISSKLCIAQDEPMLLNIICMDRKWYQDSFIQNDTKPTTSELFDFSEKGGKKFHLGQFNFEIGELVKQLEDANYIDNIFTIAHFKGLCHLILAYQIKQFRAETNTKNLPKTTLLQRELQHIMDLTDFIKGYPEVQHSVTSLCAKSGLSAAKLQQGFKFIHEQTVGEFIRNVRLTKAEYLLRTSEMNISEVVYSIGFTSRSYFCKIFKAKYGSSPKKYKNQLVRNLFRTA